MSRAALIQSWSERLAARARADDPAPPAGAAALPLAALRVRLDDGSAQAHWDVDVSDVPGRALVQPAGPPVSFPLRLAGDVWFRARVRLIPQDWQNGRGSVRASVTAVVDGEVRQLWAGRLLTAEDDVGPDGLTVACRLPARATSLRLGVEGRGSITDRYIGRVIWVEPELLDPAEANGPSEATPAAVPFTPPMNGTGGRPLISVITPVHDPPTAMLHETIDSVLAQSFTGWELCLIDDGSSRPEIIAALQRRAASDPRIHLLRRETAGGISSATNAGLELATGEYVALLDHDDTLTPDALKQVAERIAGDPSLDMIYSDEAVVDERRTEAPVFKPDWSPENICALMYTCHLGVYRRSLALAISGFRSTFDGCQDYDFVLRLAEHTDRIAHIPQILYQWRAHPSSTAGGDNAKPYAYLAQPRAIAEHLERLGADDAEVQFGPHPGMHRIVYAVDAQESVTIALAVADPVRIHAAACSWLAQPHRHYEIVLAGPAEALAAAMEVLESVGIPPSRTRAVSLAPGSSDAESLAAATAAATTDQVLVMQAPMVGLTHDWLRRLLGYSGQAGVAAAGPVVLSRDGRIADAGVAIPDGIALPLLHGLTNHAASAVAMNVGALSGVLSTRRKTLERLGGLHPQRGDLMLVDFSLRATTAGLRNVIVADARVGLTAEEYLTNDLPRLWALRRDRGGDRRDPYYNPNYRCDRGDFTPRHAA